MPCAKPLLSPSQTLAYKLFELRTVQIFAGSLVYEMLIEGDFLKLAQLLLIEGADAEIADKLTGSPLPLPL